MPCLNHDGFVSYWQYFDSCSPDTIKSNTIISFDYLSEFSLGFFNKYLKSDPSIYENKFLIGPDNEYIQAVDMDYSVITTICNTLLDNNLESAARQVDDHKTVLFEGENQLNILARMAYNMDMAIWLYQKSLKYRPDSWETHFGLAHVYKDKGETLLAKNELLKAKELNPGNTDITDLLNEITGIE
jgi:tetratricopeptide (TPR) repeat protein